MARKTNLFIDQGATFSKTFPTVDDLGNPLDLSGYAGTGQMRRHFTSNNAINLTVTFDSSNVFISLTAAASANAEGRYVYDIEATLGNTVIRAVEGIITVAPNVTRI